MYELDRKTASRLLGVSVRTVDRYVKSGRLSSQRVDGHIRLDKEEVVLLNKAKGVVAPTPKNKKINVDMSIDKPVDVDSLVYYQKLHHELRAESREQQKYLEYANYKLGQLENEVKHRLPIKDTYETAIKIKKLELDVRYQSLLKKVFLYLFILSIVLSLVLITFG